MDLGKSAIRKWLKSYNFVLILYTIGIILIYIVLNRTNIIEGGMFMFSTVAIFVWLCLVLLMVIYAMLEDIKNSIEMNVEDHLLETRLLKTLLEQQMEEMSYIKEKLDSKKKK